MGADCMAQQDSKTGTKRSLGQVDLLRQPDNSGRRPDFSRASKIKTQPSTPNDDELEYVLKMSMEEQRREEQRKKEQEEQERRRMEAEQGQRQGDQADHMRPYYRVDQEREEGDRRQRERAELEERQRAEKAERERAERQRMERERAERAQREERERQRLEREQMERVQQEHKQKERRQHQREESRRNVDTGEHQRRELLMLGEPNRFTYNVFKALVECSAKGEHKVSCMACSREEIQGIRLTCLTCKAENFCTDCFERGLQHDTRHALALVTLCLNEAGEERLRTLRGMFKDGSQKKEGVSWFSHCESCMTTKESVFLTNTDSGANMCKLCFDALSKSLRQTFVTELFPVYSSAELGDEFEVGEDGHTPERRLARLVHKKSGLVFGLNEVTVKAKSLKEYYGFRNHLMKFRSSQFLSVFAYDERRDGDSKFRILLIQEWAPELSLKTLLQSRQFFAFSIRRKFGIVRTLVSAIRKLHQIQLCHRYLRPQNIWLDQFHEVKLETVPFANIEATILSMTPEHSFREPKQPFSQEGDIFAFGLLMNLVLTGLEHSYAQNGQAVLKKKATIFDHIVANCLSDRRQRPTALDLDHYFHNFETRLWETIAREVGRKEYEKLGVGEKDALFDRVYKGFR